MNPADAWAVLGLPRGSSWEEVRRRRRVLAWALHPDRNGGDARRLAEVNAAYDVLFGEQGAAPRPAPGPAAAATALRVGRVRPEVFRALLVAAADVGDVTWSEEPYSLDVFVVGPPAGFCHLELIAPEGGGSVVSVDSDQVDASVVCAALIPALGRIGYDATID